MDSVVVAVTRSEFLNGGPRSAPKRRVFVAFRFVPESQDFKNRLTRTLEESWDVETLSGAEIAGGDDWAGAIRKHIDRARLIVADVTNTSREVMFEIGYAGNKPALYVTSSSQARARLPRWVTIKQGLTYDGAGLMEIAETIGGYFAAGTFPRAPRRGLEPGRAVLVQGKSQGWADPIVERLKTQLAEVGIFLEHCDPAALGNGQDLADFASSHLLFACIDGTSDDYLSHFYLGDVAGRQYVGSTSRTPGTSLKRLAVVLSPSEVQYESNTADSLRRVSRQVLAHASDFATLQPIVATRLASYKTYRSAMRGDMP